MAQINVFFCGIDVAFHTTEELSALIPMKETTPGTDLYQEVQKMMQSPHIAVQKPVGLVMDEAPSTVCVNSGVSSLITNDIKNTTNRDFMSLFDTQRIICTKYPKINFVRSK
jgi:hypothetical protein